MKYTSEQLKVIRTIRQVGQKRYGGDQAKLHRYVKANLEIGSVESHFRNLSGGDADSAGYRQERASLYSNPTNLRAAINRAYDEMEQHDHGQAPWKLAADIQRPRADLRGRYHDARHEAESLMGGGTKPSMQAGTAPHINPGGETTDAKGAMLAALMDGRKNMSLLDRFNAQVGSGSFTKTTAPSVTPGTPAKYQLGAKGTSTGKLGRIEAEANHIDAAQVPYLWGGGHQAKQKRGSKVTPLDCSGAVSRLLGINPRVASQFKTWGRPGRGKDFTIYAKDTHVLVEIGGHFWGTSEANPGGGAGWIPRSQISAAYLKGFTARHI